MRRSALSLLLALLTACGGPKPAPDPAPAPASAAPAAPDDAAARAAWDAAVKLRFAGDEIASHAAMIQLAARHPDTRYGRAAADGGGAGTMVAVATVGILAAVAVPAFMKYTRRSKTAEASANVRRLFDAAVAYRAVECARLGRKCAKQFKFPATVALTPTTPACQDGNSKARVPQASDWQQPTWKALKFELTEPSFYQYEFVSEGAGPKARFTARAVGDLDCNGVFSTFERAGSLDAAGNVDGGAGLMTLEDLE